MLTFSACCRQGSRDCGHVRGRRVHVGKRRSRSVGSRSAGVVRAAARRGSTEGQEHRQVRVVLHVHVHELRGRQFHEEHFFCRAGCGDAFSVFLSDNGILMTCGDATSGCLAHGDWSSTSRPKLIESLLRQNIILKHFCIGIRLLK